METATLSRVSAQPDIIVIIGVLRVSCDSGGRAGQTPTGGVVRRNWMLLKDVDAVLADRTRTVEDQAELERELEQDLVIDYITWLGRTDVHKHLFSNGREADLYDRQNRLIIEAKASHRDDVMVAHGMGQAMYYRSLDDLDPNTRVAVLLPGRPSEEVVRLLWLYDVGLIYRDDHTFNEVWP